MNHYQTIDIPTSLKLNSFADRFWRKADKLRSCWFWTAHLGKWGYGTFQVGSRKAGTNRSVLAHRVAWELSFGPIPDGMNVLHHCDNPACVRPEHLFLGSHADNVRDMIAKGRDRKAIGENNKMTKLTDEQVREIRVLYRRGVSMYQRGNAAELAQTYGVKHRTIWDVVHRARTYVK